MKYWMRSLLAIVLSVLILASPLVSLAEILPTEIPAVKKEEVSTSAEMPEKAKSEDAKATEPPVAPAVTEPPVAPVEPLVTEAPVSPVEGPEKVEPTTPVQEAPKAVEALAFKKDTIELERDAYPVKLDFVKLNDIKSFPSGSKVDGYVLSVRKDKDGSQDDSIAAFVDFDKNGEILEDNYDEEDVKETKLVVYQPGTVYVRAALKSNERIYAEFELIAKVATPAESDPATIEPTVDPDNDELLVETLIPQVPQSDDPIVADPEQPAASQPSASDNVDEDGLLVETLIPQVPQSDDPIISDPEQPSTELPVDGQTFTNGMVPNDADLSGTELSIALSDGASSDMYVGASVKFSVSNTSGLTLSDYTFNIEGDSTAYRANSDAGSEEISGFIDAIAPGSSKLIVTATAQDTTVYRAELELTVRTLPMETISIDKTDLKLNINETAVLTATADTLAESPVINWVSDNADVATVDTTGLVTAIAEGSANITATYTDKDSAEKSASCAVTVGAYPIELLPVEGLATAYALRAGNTQQLAVTAAAVTWSSSDEAFATVDAAGLVTAVAAGTATITATSENGLTCTFDLSIYTISIAAPETIGTAAPESELPFTATVLPQEAEVVWSSSNTEVATISESGVVTVVAYGDTTIRATISGHDDIYDEYPLTIGAFNLNANIELKYTLPVSGTQQLSASGSSIEWTSSDEAVATVDAAGLVTAKDQPGTTTITATPASGTPTAFIVVVARIDFYTDGNITTLSGIGETLQITAKVLPETENLTCEWASENRDIVSVNGDGLLTAVGLGTTKITADVPGSNVITSVEFTVINPATGIGIEGANFDEALKTESGSTSLTLQASILPVDSTDRIVWTYTETEGIETSLSEDGKSITIKPLLGNDGVMQVPDGFEFAVTATAGTISETRTIVFKQPATGVAITGEDIEVAEDGSSKLRLYTSKNSQGETTGMVSQLIASVSPETVTNKDVDWVSSNPEIVSIDANGLVTANATGQATITVSLKSDPDLKGELTVFARDRAELITLFLEDADNLYKVAHRYNADITYTIHARVSPASATEVYWESSDPAVATVDENGVVTCKGSGYAIITASTSDTDPYAPRAISLLKVIQHATDIQLHTDPFPGISDNGANSDGLIIAISQTVTLGITVLPEAATEKGYTLTSDNPSVLTVRNNQIKGLRTGYANVIISTTDDSGDPSQSAGARILPVRVISKGRGVTSFKLAKSAISVTTGGGYTLKTSGSPSRASYKTARWYSLDESIATVASTTGTSMRITGVSVGTTYVYAMSSSGIVRSCKVTVNPQLPTSIKILDPDTMKTVTSRTLGVGEVSQFISVPYPSTITFEEDKVTQWRSSNPKIAMVNDYGAVFAVSKGTAYIYSRTVNNKLAKCKIVVKNHGVDNRKIQISNPNSALYVGGLYTMNYDVYLNNATYNSYMTIAEIAEQSGVSGFEDIDNIHYSSPSNLCLPLDLSLLASSSTNMDVIWQSSNSKIAKVNSSTGVITALRPGTVDIRVKSRANTGSKYYGKLRVTISMPTDFNFEVYNGTSVASALTFTYGDAANSSKQLSAVTSSQMDIEWFSDNEQIATVDQTGLVAATGIGTTSIYAIIGGGIDGREIPVTVARKDGTSDVTYRALVVGLYQTSGKSGYLPFGVNSTNLVRSAIADSNIDGDRYKVSFYNNSKVTSLATFQRAVSETFKDTKEGDVSIVYLHSHGQVDKKTGEYRWLLYSSGKKVPYLTGNQIVSTINQYVKGNVLLCVASCCSGNSATASSIISRARSTDAGRTGDSSLSILCSTDGLSTSGFLNTASTFSVDFFSGGFYSAANGSLTVSELAGRTKSATSALFTAYQSFYGSSSISGSNNVQMYISDKAKDLVIYG